MFDIAIGVAGVVMVETHRQKHTFKNTFTKVGLEGFTGPTPYLPRDLLLGSGRQTDPYLATALANPEKTVRQESVHHKTIIQDDTIIAIRKIEAAVPKGTAWTLREIATLLDDSAGWNNRLHLTYALVRDSAGELSEISFEPDEEVKITYYLQFHWPRSVRVTSATVEDGRGGVETIGATFVCGWGGTIPNNWGASWFALYDHALSELPDGKGKGSSTGANGVLHSERSSVGSWRGYGCSSSNPAFTYGINFDEPLVKTNTQTLQVRISWKFKNVTPIEV